MKINPLKILVLILFILGSAQAQGGNYKPPEVKKIGLNATQISGRISNALFSPSGEWMILQTDCGFFILPAARLNEAVANLEKSLLHEGEAKGFLPSGKIVFTTSHGFFIFDATTREKRKIFQLSETDSSNRRNYIDWATFIVSENLIIAEDGSYEKDLEKGNILRFDLQKQRVGRGAQIYSFNEGSLSPNGRYVFYKHLKTPATLGEIYDIKRDVNYSLWKRFDLKRHLPNLKVFNISPLIWVGANRFITRIDGYQSDDYNIMPVWFVLLDAAAGKVVWKEEQESGPEINLQQLNSAKLLLEKRKELYEMSLTNGKLTKIPALNGTTFTVSPDKKKLAYLNSNQIFISTAKGSGKKAIFDLPEDWHGRLLYDGKGVRQIDWSPDGKRLIVFGDMRLLIIQL